MTLFAYRCGSFPLVERVDRQRAGVEELEGAGAGAGVGEGRGGEGLGVGVGREVKLTLMGLSLGFLLPPNSSCDAF